MDSIEATKIVHDRIKALEPENVARKIVGYMYLHDLPDEEMIRLAMAPDQLIHDLIKRAKAALMLPSTPPINPSPNSNPSFQFDPFSSSAFRVSAQPYWERQIVADQQPVHKTDIPFLFSDSISDEYRLPYPFMSVEEPFVANGGFVDKLEFRVKTCHYFNKGFCKHGSKCRYFHGQLCSESYPVRVFGPNSSENAAGDDQLISPGSLEKLEHEIIELLKSKRGGPVSIASLPMIYYEKYGRTLQAEGYLTESQRHGKAGYSLTKLLARLKNSIRLIDRPHGQHSVILAEDAPKYLETRGDRNDPGPIVSGSRQIYLTFPAESTFFEEDVYHYFSTFGPVQDVRIPCQQKRMFGFVTFGSDVTVKIILAKGNPHYVCGARVLVKPYREKSKLVERKYPEMCYHFDQIMDSDSDSDFRARLQSPRMFRKHLVQDHEQALELEVRRLSQLQLAGKHLSNQSCFGYSMDELKLSEEADGSKLFPTPEQEMSEGLNLPYSLFQKIKRISKNVN